MHAVYSLKTVLIGDIVQYSQERVYSTHRRVYSTIRRQRTVLTGTGDSVQYYSQEIVYMQYLQEAMYIRSAHGSRDSACMCTHAQERVCTHAQERVCTHAQERVCTHAHVQETV